MIARHLYLPCLALSFLLAATAGTTGDRRAMTPVDVLNIPQLSDPRLSPDGSQFLYVKTEAEWEQNKWIGHIWRGEADGSGSLQLTNGAEGESSPRWSPDGKYIAFIASRKASAEQEATPQIYLIANNGGEARVLTSHETAVSDIAWSADGQSLYFLAADPKPEEQKEREEQQDDMVEFIRSYQQQHLWRVAVSDGSEQRVSGGDYSVFQYRLSRGGDRIVYARSPTPLLYDLNRSELWVMDSEGAAERRLTDNGVVEMGGELSPDGGTVLFLSGSNASFESYYNNKLFLVPAAGGKHRVLLPELPYAVAQATWSADGQSIYFVAHAGVRSELFEVEVASGSLRQLTRGDHSITDWMYQASGDTHLLGLNTPANGGDLWVVSAAGDRRERVTRVYDYLQQEFELPRQEAIRWQGADGAQVEGLVHYPLGYREGESYPLVVQTHGGPASADRFGIAHWLYYTPVLAGKGYMVFKPNYRGSTGYGDEFLRGMVGHYFEQSHLDVMTGVDELIRRGLTDSERMVKMGWSAGGHMTNKIITHTDRFKAASSGAGAVNWISMFGQTDINFHRTAWFGGTPWQENAPIDSYWRSSPLSDIARVKTPTLVIVGAEDARVPAAQSIELFRALRSNGVPAHLYLAPREPHLFNELRHALFKINVELEWFEHYALGREYEWQAVPGVQEDP